MEKTDLNSRLIYSTSQGPICPDCAQAVAGCLCADLKKRTVFATDGIVRLRYETNGRKGKGVTLISGLALNENGLLDLAKKLKQRFATGGAVKGGLIQLQGDFRDRARQELSKLGYRVK